MSEREQMAGKPTRRRRAKRNGWAYTLVALQALCVLLPLAVVFIWAFTASWPWPNLVPESLSARGIEDLFAPQQHMPQILATSIGVALATALLSTLVAGMAARAICHYRPRGRDALEFGMLLPLIIPSTVFAMGVQVAFTKAGLTGTVVGVVLSHTIIALPYAAMIMVDTTAAAGTKMEEVARVSGASSLQLLRTVTVPQLLPGILSSASMGFIISFSQYFITLIIGGGKVKTLALIMFPYLSSGDRTMASAYGAVFLVVIFAVFLLFEVLLRKQASRDVGYFNG